MVCRDGATAGDDFAPYAADGLNATCADFIEEIKVNEAGSKLCVDGSFEDIRSMCCPETLPENPCIACPDGTTAGDDFVPWVKWGDNKTCKEAVDSFAVYGAESEMCAFKNSIKVNCCPTTTKNPCIMCPDGATAGDDFAPYAEYEDDPATCKDYIDDSTLYEEGTKMCEMSQKLVGHCCPTTLENPCIMCPDGATAGDDFMPYAEGGNLIPCKAIIEEYNFVDAGNFLCDKWKTWDEAGCCPTAPKNPCNICPDGLTVADDFFPPGESQTCKQNIDTLKLIETDSEICSKDGQYYKVLCCPNVTVTTSTTVAETSTAATTIARNAAATGLTSGATTTDTTTSTASTSSGATSASATGNSELTTTTATVDPSTEPTPSGGVTVDGFGGCAFILGVSALYSIA